MPIPNQPSTHPNQPPLFGRGDEDAARAARATIDHGSALLLGGGTNECRFLLPAIFSHLRISPVDQLHDIAMVVTETVRTQATCHIPGLLIFNEEAPSSLGHGGRIIQQTLHHINGQNQSEHHFSSLLFYASIMVAGGRGEGTCISSSPPSSVIFGWRFFRKGGQASSSS